MLSQKSGFLTIQLKDVSKKFGSNWIFKNVNIEFEQGRHYAITGPNGSGKSTLLKVIGGLMSPNKGIVNYSTNGNLQEISELYREISFCSPYMELPEELTLTELLNFHQNLRPLEISADQLISFTQLEGEKQIRNYSSGMKQRLKLALAFYTRGKVLLLDEPTSTLDEHWNEWYLQTVKTVAAEKLLIISSNHSAEYSFCETVLKMNDFKA